MSVNYIDRIARQIGAIVDDCPIELLRVYALLALRAGTATSREDVHDAWAVWRAATKPEHPALVPFAELSPEVQALDDPYVEAIREVAKTLCVKVSAGQPFPRSCPTCHQITIAGNGCPDAWHDRAKTYGLEA